MFLLKNSRPKALVIGSILVDLVLDAPDVAKFTDSIAHLDKLRLGGCAYNIFVNLRSLEVDAQITSAVRRNSPLKLFIETAVKKSGATRSRVISADVEAEGVFVSLLSEGRSYRAATSTVVDKVSTDSLLLRRELPGSAVCIIDLSLSESQIKEVLRECTSREIPLICNGTSDGRIRKIHAHMYEGRRFHSLICSRPEAETLFGLPLEKIKKLPPADLCRTAHCTYLIITLGENGFLHVDSTLDRMREELAPDPDLPIISSLGAGDALTACYAAELALAKHQGRPFSFDIFRQKISHRVTQILTTKGATEDFDISISNWSFFDRIGGDFVLVNNFQIAGAIAGILGLLAAVFAH